MTRVAASSPEMWDQICASNSEDISVLLGDYIDILTEIKKNIDNKTPGYVNELFEMSRARLNKQSSIGFNSDLKDKYDNDKNILSKVELEDLREFGMIPEFLGRLPIVFSLEGLTEDMLVKIMKEPKNAILKQYQKLLELDEVKLEFDDDALRQIAKKAMEKDTGARALRSIIEESMLRCLNMMSTKEIHLHFCQHISFLSI